MGAIKSCFHLALMTYAGFVAAVQAHDAFQLAGRRQRQVAELEALHVRAQLQHLKEQLNPHFLFNTLHAIGSLMHYDVPTADRMLQRLGDLLRLSLDDRDALVTTLDRELAFVEAYLDVEQIRFSRRLRVDWSVPETLRASQVPALVLQPLVENAIKHGIAPRAEGGRIAIRARRDGEALVLEVEDDAPAGLPPRRGFGLGLSNVRRRLAAFYGRDERLELVREGAGTIARLRLPSRTTVPAREGCGGDAAGLSLGGSLA
jgi:LytS/YehU family sensor histidine kinase